MLVAERMAIFFLLMLVGLACRKFEIITQENQRSLSSLVVNVGCPALILSSVAGGVPRLSGEELLETTLTVAATIAILLLFAQILPMLMNYGGNERGAVRDMLVFTNIAFMGIPLILGVYGQDAILYLTLFILPFNLLFFSYGVQTMRVGGGKMSWSVKNLLNPGIIACSLTILLYGLEITLPPMLVEPLKILGSLTTPLAMLLIGASLSELSFAGIFSDKKLLAFMAVKMIIFPTAYLLALQNFSQNRFLLGACFVALAMPTGNMVAMLATLYNKEAYSLTVKEISLTTAISVVTLPLVAFLTKIG